MEIANLIGINNIEEVLRFTKLYAQSTESREKIITELLEKNPFNIEKIDISDQRTTIRHILDELLLVLGIELEN